MPQYTIKLHTYDPEIVEAFERLRKNRKQAAFTHEALKHFIASGKASQTIVLMSKEHRSPLLLTATGTKHQETIRDDVPVGPELCPVAATFETKSAHDDMLKKILE